MVMARTMSYLNLHLTSGRGHEGFMVMARTISCLTLHPTSGKNEQERGLWQWSESCST